MNKWILKAKEEKCAFKKTYAQNTIHLNAIIRNKQLCFNYLAKLDCCSHTNKTSLPPLPMPNLE